MVNRIRFPGQLVLLGAISWSCDSGNTGTVGGTATHTGTSTITTTGTGTGTGTATGTGACNTPAACGGVVDGTWQIDSTCVDGNLLAAVSAQAGLPAACNGVYQSVSLTTSGTVTFAGGTQTDNVTTTSNASTVFTSACYSAISGTPTTLTAASCTTLQSQMADPTTGSTATCTFSGGNCNCTSIQTSTSTAQKAYTSSGTSLVFSNGDDPVDYCVSGTTMTVSQASTSLGGTTIVYTLHKV